MRPIIYNYLEPKTPLISVDWGTIPKLSCIINENWTPIVFPPIVFTIPNVPCSISFPMPNIPTFISVTLPSVITGDKE